MACSLFKLLKIDVPGKGVHQVRHGHWLRGKAPGIARTLKQRIDGNTHYS